MRIVGGGFKDQAWEYPDGLVPKNLPDLTYVSGPMDQGLAAKAAWRKPIAYVQKRTGVTVAVNCYRKRQASPLREGAGAGAPRAPVTPFAPLTEPDYRYEAVEFHGLKAAAADAEGVDVFVFRQGDILQKIQAAHGTAAARREAVHLAAQAIWAFRQRKQ